jgi:hypothetical protein
MVVAMARTVGSASAKVVDTSTTAGASRTALGGRPAVGRDRATPRCAGPFISIQPLVTSRNSRLCRSMRIVAAGSRDSECLRALLLGTDRGRVVAGISWFVALALEDEPEPQTLADSEGSRGAGDRNDLVRHLYGLSI